MMSEFCPKCNELRNMVETSSARAIFDPSGKKKVVKTRLFHCQICNSFVRSENIFFNDLND